MMNLPEAFSERMQSLLGDDFTAFSAALDESPAVSYRLHPQKGKSPYSTDQPVPWCEGAFYLDERPAFVRDPLIHAGAYYVQEASSMLIRQGLPEMKGLKVLDLCAAPGGKSTLLASFMDEDSILVSNEMVASRSRVLAENMSRWGMENVLVTQGRAEQFSGLTEYFDLILIDAPCSGEGMFRKDEEALRQWSPALVRRCAEVQQQILAAILPTLKTGGRLIYSTCTWSVEENEANLQWMLDQYPGAVEIQKPDFPDAWGTQALPQDQYDFHPSVFNGRRCYPHRVRGEGFFISCLTKTGKISAKTPDPVRMKRKSGWHIDPVKKEESQMIAREWMDGEGVNYRMGQEVFLAPGEVLEAAASLAGETIRIIQAGIRAGEVKGKKFIPAHELALSAWVKDIAPVELSYEDAIRFFKREPLEARGLEKGWHLARYAGVNLGWMKAVDQRINIHLPQSWKIRADVSDWF